nr:unnamed protein product [Callosobruchus chinensis]
MSFFTFESSSQLDTNPERNGVIQNDKPWWSAWFIETNATTPTSEMSRLLKTCNNLQLFRKVIKARKYFSPSNLLTLYKAQIRPSLEYCSHIWGAAAPTTLSILDAVQRRAIPLIGDPALTCHLQPLAHRSALGGRGLLSLERLHNRVVIPTACYVTRSILSPYLFCARPQECR